jgi:predicted nucleic acid-binding protein
LSRFVLDASVGLAWFIDRPAPPYAIRVKESLLRDSRAVVPGLWHLEMANGLAIAERRGYFTPADSERVLTDIEVVVTRAVDTDTQLFSTRESLLVARELLLTAYDAAYLELSRRLRLPLSTLDRALQRAAAAVGVEIFR